MENNVKYYSVSAINRYIFHKFDIDVNLQEVYVKGEISNFKWSGKHCYFSLKDAESELSAMFFFPANTTLKFQPKDGMSVQIIGKIQVYQKRGTYSIVVKQMIQEGVGILYQQYLDLKEKLFKEGLFDEDKKLPIPEYPEKVAVITAPTGEAIHDIISTFNRRLPLAEIKLYPALVQGADAPADLIKALNKVYYDNEADVIIIGRGGGSFEDLACFNDERLARTLFASPIPTISAIGHEGDYTICDFVSSFRAPTPTGAAMKLTKDKKDVIQLVDDTTYLLVSSMKHKLINDFNRYDRLVKSYGLAKFDEYLSTLETKVDNLDKHLKVLSPMNIAKNLDSKISDLSNRLNLAINNVYQNKLNNFASINKSLRSEYVTDLIDRNNILVNNLEEKISNLCESVIDKETNRLEQLIQKTILLNPFNVMLKGYSIVYYKGKVVSNINDVKEKDNIEINVTNGKIFAEVTGKEEK